jgi:hypothetical protein
MTFFAPLCQNKQEIFLVQKPTMVIEEASTLIILIFLAKLI